MKRILRRHHFKQYYITLQLFKSCKKTARKKLYHQQQQVLIRDAPDTDIAEYPASLKPGYRISGEGGYRIFGKAGYRISFRIINSTLK
jgi:hypothetical protein